MFVFSLGALFVLQGLSFEHHNTKQVRFVSVKAERPHHPSRGHVTVMPGGVIARQGWSASQVGGGGPPRQRRRLEMKLALFMLQGLSLERPLNVTCLRLPPQPSSFSENFWLNLCICAHFAVQIFGPSATKLGRSCGVTSATW